MSDTFADILETFENQYRERDYTIEIVCPRISPDCTKHGQILSDAG